MQIQRATFILYNKQMHEIHTFEKFEQCDVDYFLHETNYENIQRPELKPKNAVCSRPL